MHAYEKLSSICQASKESSLGEKCERKSIKLYNALCRAVHLIQPASRQHCTGLHRIASLSARRTKEPVPTLCLAIFDAGRESLVHYQTFTQTNMTKQGARCHQELTLARLTAPGTFPVTPRSTPLGDHQSPTHLHHHLGFKTQRRTGGRLQTTTDSKRSAVGVLKIELEIYRGDSPSNALHVYIQQTLLSKRDS